MLAIHTVAAGRPYLCSELGLQLLAEGLTNADVTEQLRTSSKRTIENHRQHLLAKTSNKNVAALIKPAVLQGLVW